MINRRIFLHKKSGKFYKKLTEGRLEADRTIVTVYESLGNFDVWVRPSSEFNERFEEKARLTLQEWMSLVSELYSDVQFTEDTGRGETYGEVGDWVAHVGTDMQSDVVGVFVASENFCRVDRIESGGVMIVLEFEVDATQSK